MGHVDFKTTQIYARHSPGEHEAALVAKAFEGFDWFQSGSKVPSGQINSDQVEGTGTTHG
jgi:hypothetical protein